MKFIQLPTGKCIRAKDIVELVPTGPDKPDDCDQKTTYHGVRAVHRKQRTIIKHKTANDRDAYLAELLLQMKVK